MAVMNCDLNILPVDYLSHMWQMIGQLCAYITAELWLLPKSAHIESISVFWIFSFKVKGSKAVGVMSLLHGFVASVMRTAKQHKVT